VSTREAIRAVKSGCGGRSLIHDEIICEVSEDENLPARVAEIERLMIEGMQKVVPGANVRGEPEVRRSFSKADNVLLTPSK